jgi:hypothetical protein
MLTLNVIGGTVSLGAALLDGLVQDGQVKAHAVDSNALLHQRREPALARATHAQPLGKADITFVAMYRDDDRLAPWLLAVELRHPPA